MKNKVFIPASLKEALLRMEREKLIPLAGGTDFMVQNKRAGGLSVTSSHPLILVAHLREIKGLSKKNSQFVLGGAATFNEILSHKELPPAFLTACREIASTGIRNVATIAGNICNASPAADILPALYCLDAELVLSSLHEDRLLPIEEFISGPGKTTRKDNELLTEIRFSDHFFEKEMFRKIGSRKANALAKLSVCAMVNVINEKITDFHVAFGAVGPTVVRSRDLEEELIAKDSSWLIKNMGATLAKYNELITPISDQRSTAKYRRRVSINILKDFLLREIWSN